MIRLEEICVDPSVPEFAKPHPKQESIWGQQYPRPFNMANLKEYPAIGEEIEAWKQGIKIARRLARSVGMIPTVSAQDKTITMMTMTTMVIRNVKVLVAVWITMGNIMRQM